MLFFQLPWLPEYWLQRHSFTGVAALWRAWSANSTDPALLPHFQATISQFSDPLILNRALAYYRQNVPALLSSQLGLAAFSTVHLAPFTRAPLTDVSAMAWLLGVESTTLEIPVLFVIGSDDGCMYAPLFEASVRAQDFAKVQTKQIAGAGHWVHLEKSSEFNRLLSAWFHRQHVHVPLVARGTQQPDGH